MTVAEQIQKYVTQLPPEKQQEVLDFVTFLYLPRNTTTTLVGKERASHIRKSLKSLAKMKAFADISEPVEWQRNIREDRPLPGHTL